MIEMWRIIERIDGYVDSMEIGQTEWSPVFRSRRLSEGAKMRVQPNGKGSMSLADGSRFVFTATTHPIVVEMSAFELTVNGEKIVFQARYQKILNDVKRILGVNGRFEIREVDPAPAARG